MTSTLLQNQILHKTLNPIESKLHVFPEVINVKRTTQFSTRCDVYKSTKYDYVIRVILLGDQGVGKSSLFKALRVHPDAKKIECKCRVPHSTDHLEIEVVTSVGKTALVRLCDTGGQERYRSLTSSYYRGAHGAILVFDLKFQKSLDSVESWLTDLDTFSSASSCTRVLLGSNCTAQDRQVTTQTARRYADSRSLPYMEFDASQFFNVIESLQLIVEKVSQEVTITPTSHYVIKPLPPFLENSQSYERKAVVCLC
uniref:SOCS box domain-containing protein n=1 Tax=Arion vulgaris TaxID=1028688 RepID=A0A0B6ZIX3_9EUPU